MSAKGIKMLFSGRRTVGKYALLCVRVCNRLMNVGCQERKLKARLEKEREVKEQRDKKGKERDEKLKQKEDERKKKDDERKKKHDIIE